MSGGVGGRKGFNICEGGWGARNWGARSWGVRSWDREGLNERREGFNEVRETEGRGVTGLEPVAAAVGRNGIELGGTGNRNGFCMTAGNAEDETVFKVY